MAEYACFCTGCNTFQFTPWGVRICPSCGAALIQSRVGGSAFTRLSTREKYSTFLPLVKEGSPESELLNAGMQSHEEVRKIQMQRDEEAIQKEEKKKQMLVTACFSPEGFRIKRTYGCVFSDQSVLIPAYISLMTEAQGGQSLAKTAEKLRKLALDDLMDKALDLGANALTGVDFRYFTAQLQDNCEVCLSARAEAAVIEESDE